MSKSAMFVAADSSALESVAVVASSSVVPEELADGDASGARGQKREGEQWWETAPWLALLWRALGLRAPTADEPSYHFRLAQVWFARLAALTAFASILATEVIGFLSIPDGMQSSMLLVFVPGIWLLVAGVTLLFWRKQRLIDEALADIPRGELRRLRGSLLRWHALPLVASLLSLLTSNPLASAPSMFFFFNALRAVVMLISLRRWEAARLARRLLVEGVVRERATELLQQLFILRQKVRRLSDGLRSVLLPLVAGSALGCIAFALSALSQQLPLHVALSFAALFAGFAFTPLTAAAQLTDGMRRVFNDWLHAAGPAATAMQADGDAMLKCIVSTRTRMDAFVINRTPVTIGVVFRSAYTLVLVLIYVAQQSAASATTA